LSLRLALLGSFLLGVFLALPASAESSESPDLTVRITPQVVEADQSVSWEQPLKKTTKTGVPVVVNILAEGLGIRITVTPFVRGADYLIVVQSDVRETITNGRVHGKASLQSALVPPGESIAYFPLGRDADESARQMVVLIRVEASGD